MADLNSVNRTLFIKRYEHQKMTALCNIQAREIRIIELEEEIQRNKVDIEAQKKVIEEAEKNVKLQQAEMAKEQKP